MIKYVQWWCVMCMLILPTISFAQQWVARYNGPANGSDIAYALAIDGSGNVYVTGESQALSGSADYLTIKYYADGDTAWVRRYNGPGNDYDRAYAIAADSTGAVYVTGGSQGFGVSMDCATIKYYATGDTAWVRRYNGPVDGWDEARALAIDGSCNVYVTGQSQGFSGSADYLTIKYHANGDTAWVRRRHIGSWNYATAIALDATGNVYVTGGGNQTMSDYVTVKYDSLGVEQWVVQYNGPGNGEDAAEAIVVDNTGNICVTGSSFGGYGTYDDYATVKYDTHGIEQWVARYGGEPPDGATAIATDSAGDIYVTGCSFSNYATIKYDTAGVERWVAIYTGPLNQGDGANAITLDNEGNIYVTGGSMGFNTNNDYATVQYDTSGTEQWVARYNGPSNADDCANAVAVDNVGNIYVTGQSHYPDTDNDYATIKYSPTGLDEQKITAVKSNYLAATIFHGLLKLPEGKKCRVFDITGRVVEPSKMTHGIYFIEVDGVVTQKVVKVR